MPTSPNQHTPSTPPPKPHSLACLLLSCPPCRQYQTSSLCCTQSVLPVLPQGCPAYHGLQYGQCVTMGHQHQRGTPVLLLKLLGTEGHATAQLAYILTQRDRMSMFKHSL